MRAFVICPLGVMLADILGFVLDGQFVEKEGREGGVKGDNKQRWDPKDVKINDWELQKQSEQLVVGKREE